ncbi:hypothetical protein KAR91_18375 [Candidatus Pacearchaeota archaeon]|nr:hypothetical protein [Candidatus Pacearchaeota archaeon]
MTATYDPAIIFAPTKHDSPRIIEVIRAAQALAETIQAQSRECQEQNLALRSIKEAVFWIDAAVTRENQPAQKTGSKKNPAK